MAMSFGSGKETLKYDKVVPEEVIHSMDNLNSIVQTQLDSVNEELTNFKHITNNSLDRILYEYNLTHQRLDETENKLNIVLNYISANSTKIEVMSVFIESKLFKFLNFFGRWYFIDVNRVRHLNIPDNRNIYAKYKSPFRYKFEAKLSAIKKFFKSIKK